MFKSAFGMTFSLAAALCAGLLIAQPEEAGAAGLLTPAGGGPQLDLQDHQVSVVIEDGYAITTIDQVFANATAREMEAIYSFPVPRKAAVSEFTYWIDGKPVSGEVVEKQKAREIYEGEKQAGREAGLAEQDDYRSFDISVWPVLPQDDVRVRLSYIQPAHLDTGIGRYLYPLEEGGVDEQKLAFWTANEEVSGTFSFDLHLRSDYVVEALRLPEHPAARVWQEADGSWRVHIDNAAAAKTPEEGDSLSQPAAPGVTPISLDSAQEEEGPVTRSFQPVRLDRDILVYWRQKADEPARVDLVAYKAADGERGSFMLTLTPGMDLKPITQGRDWVFVLDRSGSMGGKIATLAEGVSQALRKLNPEDRFRIVAFNDGVIDLQSQFLPVTDENLQRALGELHALTADGGTNLFGGLQRGLDVIDADRISALVLVTDGVANVGRTQTRDFFELMETHDVRLFTAIMGNSANRPLLEPLTQAANGFAASVSNADDVAGLLLQATAKVTHEALHGLSLELTPESGGLRIADVRGDQIETLYRGEQLVLFGHYWGEGAAQLSLSGEISGKPVRYETRFDFPAAATLNPEVERLWGFAEIERGLQQIALLGDDADVKQSVVDTSKEYGILSPYTSMVVLRDERFQELGIERNNQQRLTKEEQSRQKRQGMAVTSNRVGQSQPMFSSPRPSHGGGSGDMGLIGLYIAVTLLIIGISLRRRRGA